jgi:PIN domain nuclease of toxin-antitoxin system
MHELARDLLVTRAASAFAARTPPYGLSLGAASTISISR